MTLKTIKNAANTLFVILSITVFTNKTIAQEIRIPNSLEVVEGNFELNGQLRNGYSIVCYAESKSILSSFKDYMKDNYTIKLSQSKDQLKGEELLSTSISEKHFDLFAEMQSDKLIVWMALGKDVFVSKEQYASESSKLILIIKNSVKAYYDVSITEEIENSQKLVEKSQKQLDKEIKDLESINKGLKKNEANIKKSEKAEQKIQSKLESYQDKLSNEKSKLVELKTDAKKMEAKLSVVTQNINDCSEDFEKKKSQRDELNNLLLKLKGL